MLEKPREFQESRNDKQAETLKQGPSESESRKDHWSLLTKRSLPMILERGISIG